MSDNWGYRLDGWLNDLSNEHTVVFGIFVAIATIIGLIILFLLIGLIIYIFDIKEGCSQWVSGPEGRECVD